MKCLCYHAESLTNENDTSVRSEAVHFREELVECLLSLFIPSEDCWSALAPKSVDLIDKDDAWRINSCPLEQVSNLRDGKRQR